MSKSRSELSTILRKCFGAFYNFNNIKTNLYVKSQVKKITSHTINRKVHLLNYKISRISKE